MLPVLHQIFDVIRFVQRVELQGHGALDLVAHGFEDGVVRGVDLEDECETDQAGKYFHWPAPELIGGGGRIGGRFCDFSIFSISISDTRMAGDTTATGTHPDSAPQ